MSQDWRRDACEGDTLSWALEGGCLADTPAFLLANAWVALAPPLVKECLHLHTCNIGTLAGLSLFLSTAAIPPWEGGANTLDCVQGPSAVCSSECSWSPSCCQEDSQHCIFMLGGTVAASAQLF